MTPPPAVSVIVPTHCRARLLRRALESLKAQAGAERLEVIVVSDAADPPTDAVCTELLGPEDTYLRRSGSPGPSASRNLGLSLARGGVVAFLDDDDAWHPGCLAALCGPTPLRDGTPIYLNCSIVTERRPAEGPETLSEVGANLAGGLTPEVYVKNQVHMSCFAFPRAMLHGLAFDPFMRAYEDWDFLLAVFDRQMPVHVPALGSRIFEVRDDTTDRRGASRGANDYNAVLDYLYVYRRHPAPHPDLAARRVELLGRFGLTLTPDLL